MGLYGILFLPLPLLFSHVLKIPRQLLELMRPMLETIQKLGIVPVLQEKCTYFHHTFIILACLPITITAIITDITLNSYKFREIVQNLRGKRYRFFMIFVPLFPRHASVPVQLFEPISPPRFEIVSG